jgi:hypothetical protein
MQTQRLGDLSKLNKSVTYVANAQQSLCSSNNASRLRARSDFGLICVLSYGARFGISPINTINTKLSKKPLVAFPGVCNKLFKA